MRKSHSVLLFALGAAAVMLAAVAASDDRDLRINDKCDAATFPPEAGCVGGGNVTFQQFLATLNPVDGGHKAWSFKFGGHLKEGESLHLINEGGEPHSFVEVSSYGTGVVPPLNGALPPGTPPAVPIGGGSLDQANAANIVLPHGTRDVAGLAPGMHKFQCLIHPWMQIEIEVRDDHGNNGNHGQH